MVKSSANNAKAIFVVLSLRDVHLWLDDEIGPVAHEALRLLTESVLDCTAIPPSWKHLQRFLANQGVEQVRASALMRQGYARVVDCIRLHLPNIDVDLMGQPNLEYSMRNYRDLVLVLQSDMLRSP